MLTPGGRRLDQALVNELAQHQRLLLLCGRYEGFDERIRLGLEPMEVSIGDFVCNGGEVPAMVVIDTVIRLVPGVLGDENERDRGIAQHSRHDGISAVHEAASVSRHGSARSAPERQPSRRLPVAQAAIHGTK